MRRIRPILIGMLLLFGLLSRSEAVAPPPPDQWIVVVAPAFQEALAPLIKARADQGLRVRLVLTTKVATPEQLRRGEANRLRDHVHALCRDHPGRSFVLLVGAVSPRPGEQPEQIVVPALPGSIGRMKGEPSDNGYGCPGGGRIPTVPVGRFPVRTAEEARALVERTLAYESGHGEDHARRLTVLAGIPAYNPVVDRMVENLALARFEKLAPAWSGKALYTHPRSRFCVPDALLKKTTIRYLEEGAAFTVYLGHSSAQGLYAGEAPFLDRKDCANLKIARPGVFVTFGCNGCQLQGADGEGYGVAAVRNPRGPVAVIGSHGICFAAMVQLAADGLFRRAFQDELPNRLGTAWLAVPEGVARGSMDPFTFAMLDAVDGDRRIPQATQRQEHLEMFLLLGDPALRLPRPPAPLPLETGPLLPGRSVRITGQAPAALEGRSVRVTLERSVSSTPNNLEPLPPFPGSGRDRVMLRNHERANDFVVAAGEAAVRAGQFTLTLAVPDPVPGSVLTIRAWASRDGSAWLGALRVRVPRP